MAHRTWHEHDVAVTFPERLVGDVNVSALGIACMRPAGFCRAVWGSRTVVEAGVLTKDPLVELAQLGTRLDAKLTGERCSQLPVCT